PHMRVAAATAREQGMGLLTQAQPAFPWGTALGPRHIGESIGCEWEIPITPRRRKGMTQDVEFSVQCAWLYPPQPFGAVRAHHPGGLLTEGHAGQWLPQERIQGERLAIGSPLAGPHPGRKGGEGGG